MRYYNYLFWILISLLFSCASKVLVSTTDRNPPETRISIAQKGRIATATSHETKSQSVEMLEGTDLKFFANASDSLGVKSLTIEVVQNGNFEIDYKLYPSYNEEAPAIDSNGMGINYLNLVGTLHPDLPKKEMIIRAESEDHANNSSMTPPLHIEFIKKAEGRISATRTTIKKLESVTIHYESDNANKVSINGSVKNTFNGAMTEFPMETTTYVLKAENHLSVDTDSITVQVIEPINSPLISEFVASPKTITKGQSSTLSWTIQNMERISIAPTDYSSNIPSGSRTIRPTTTTTYTLTAKGPGGSTTRTTQVKVNPPVSPIECITTPISIFMFNYVGFSGNHFYSMNLSKQYMSSTSITKITNRTNVPIRLWTDGRSVIIDPDKSTDIFNNYQIDRDWAIETAQRISSPQIEFCYKEF